MKLRKYLEDLSVLRKKTNIKGLIFVMEELILRKV